jgi:hypothetical protein
VSTLLHATVYVFTEFAECISTDCKLNRITKKNCMVRYFECDKVFSV